MTTAARARWWAAGFTCGAVLLPLASGLIAEALYRRTMR